MMRRLMLTAERPMIRQRYRPLITATGLKGLDSEPRNKRTTPGRYKRVIGDALRSRTKGRQMTEVAIAVASLNRMLELGRPKYVRVT